jgi:hypothetical protein
MNGVEYEASVLAEDLATLLDLLSDLLGRAEGEQSLGVDAATPEYDILAVFLLKGAGLHSHGGALDGIEYIEAGVYKQRYEGLHRTAAVLEGAPFGIIVYPTVYSLVKGHINIAEGVCGAEGGAFRYRMKKNLTFNRPGTLLFFFKGIDWKTTPGNRIFFTGIESGKGFFGLQVPGWPKNVCPCSRELHVMFMYSKKFKNKTFFAKMPGGEAECGKWHMIAFSWAPGQLRVNMDNLSGKTYQIDFDLTDDAFPYEYFSVGYAMDRQFLIDEYTVYNRRLSDGELAEIFNKYMKSTK